MTAPQLGPCAPWANEGDLCSPCDDVYGGASGTIDPIAMDNFMQMASNILFYASGQQFPGLCEKTIRPCTRRAFGGTGGPFTRPVVIGTRWEYITPACGCGEIDRCGCGDLEQLTLIDYPIVEVSEVKVDGDVLSPSAYRVDDYQYLVRIDGESFPCCQDLSLDDTEENTFSVTYEFGHAPPPEGVHAAAILACELYLGCQPEDGDGPGVGECRLPRNIASLARQGVTVDFQLAQSLFVKQNGRPIDFGIPEINMFLATANPHGLTAPSYVASPDTLPHSRIVGT